MTNDARRTVPVIAAAGAVAEASEALAGTDSIFEEFLRERWALTDTDRHQLLRDIDRLLHRLSATRAVIAASTVAAGQASVPIDSA